MSGDAVMAESELLQRVIAFIRSIGIDVTERAMHRPTLVPGIDLDRGTLAVEERLLASPADLLHEAGHIALRLPEERAALDGTFDGTPAEEITNIAWTWAAAMHLGIAPAEVFHEEVISGNGPTLRENFETGHYVGVPGLQRWGLTTERKYPAMEKWTR